MNEGNFPNELKTGKISPIYKKDNEDLLENYRPVSTLAIFGKIFEKIIFSRLYSFMTSQKILYENQFGFRKQHSTNHAINYSVTHIKKLTREKNHVLGIFIDLRKAFDTISHEKLLIKALSKKLASCTGSLNRIIKFLPKNMHKELYYTLFESYLAYGVTVWRKASKSKLRLLFKAQKKAIRVVFGYKEQFLDKFRTCAKARPYPDQKLGQEFFNKEHTKPLFIANHILTLQNLNFYHTCSEIFKIFKYRNPISIFEKFKFSARGSKNLFITTPHPSNLYIYHASVAWNFARTLMTVKDTSTSISTFKEKLKKHLLCKQALGDGSNWIETNFVN